MQPPKTPPSTPGPSIRVFLEWIRCFELFVVGVLILLMIAVVGFSVFELAVTLVRNISEEPRFMINLPDLLSLLGLFMMVLIGLELLETVKNYLTDNALHVEIVLLVAMIAVARKVIILDMKAVEPMAMVGIAVLLGGLALSYRVVKFPPNPNPKPGHEQESASPPQ